MDIPEITFNVSGTAHSVMSGSELMQRPERYDGTEEGIRAGETLMAAPSRKMGKGYTLVVTLDVVAASVVWEYCHDVGSTFCMESDPETRRDGRALLEVRDRVEKAIAATGWTPPTLTARAQPPAPAATLAGGEGA